MKQSTIQEIQNLVQKESVNANTLIAICETNDNITISMQGQSGRIGEALFAAMHDTKNAELAKETYLMIKNIVYNIIKNQSPMANDMMNMLLQVIDESSISQSAEQSTTPFIPQGEA